jgi:tyrosine-protein kinase Etk/Wzc
MTVTLQDEASLSHQGGGAGVRLDVLTLLLPLVRFKYAIVIGTVFGFLCAMTIALLTKSEYTGVAVIMPPQQGQSSAALIGQLGGLASISGLGGGALHDPNDLYIALLQSESVTEGVIHRLGLEGYYHTPNLFYAKLVLWGSSKFSSEHGGLIRISVKDRSPAKAALIANTYAEELKDFTDTLTVTEASRRAAFFFRELDQQKRRLEESEAALQQTQQATGAIAPASQTNLIIQQVSDLEAQIRAREVQLNAMRLSSTDQNPDVVQATRDLAMLRTQLHTLESGGKNHVPGDVLISSQTVPGAQLTYNRRLRDVTYQNYLVDLIQRQYEAARLDEAKAAPVIQLVDSARTPIKKSGPARTLWTLVGAGLAFVISCLTVEGLFLLQCVRKDEELMSRLLPFERALRAGL